MTTESAGTGSPEKKKFKIGVEMEVWGKDGTELTGGDLWETVEVDALNEDEARDIVFNKMDFGNKTPNGFCEVEELGKPKEEPPFQGVSLGK